MKHRRRDLVDGFDVGNADLCYTDTGSTNTMTHR